MVESEAGYFLGHEFNSINGREYKVIGAITYRDRHLGQKKRFFIGIPAHKGDTNVFVLDVIQIGDVKVKVYDKRPSLKEMLDLELILK